MNIHFAYGPWYFSLLLFDIFFYYYIWHLRYFATHRFRCMLLHWVTSASYHFRYALTRPRSYLTTPRSRRGCLRWWLFNTPLGVISAPSLFIYYVWLVELFSFKSHWFRAQQYAVNTIPSILFCSNIPPLRVAAPLPARLATLRLPAIISLDINCADSSQALVIMHLLPITWLFISYMIFRPDFRQHMRTPL